MLHMRIWIAGALLATCLVAGLTIGVATTTAVGSAAGGRAIEPTRGAVAAPHPVAAEYGAQVLREGGNAVDAAVATALMLGVVDGHNSGIGGGCFILIRTAEGELVAIDGRETAPALAQRDMFLRDGKADPELSTLGALAVGTPGMLAACELALREHGTKTLAELLRGAAEVAEQGFEVNSTYAARLAAEAESIRRFPATAEMLLKPDGSPYRAGETLALPDLARTYRSIADNGLDWFYRGRFARQVDAWMQENDGLLRYDDFAGYEAKARDPVVTRYRAYTIVGFPPPSSGGLHVGQILNILEHFELAELDEPTRRHVTAEAMKLAFADRAHWLGDPDFARVPRGLTSREYAAELAGRIDIAKATPVKSHGTPPGAETDVFGRASNIEHRTSNVQHRRPEESPATATSGTSMFDVGRSMFDVQDPPAPPLPPGEGGPQGRVRADIQSAPFIDRPHPAAAPPPSPGGRGGSERASGTSTFDVGRSMFDVPTRSHTAHLSAADEHGNWVALTSTVNTGFGSKVVVPGTGVILNNQMDDFAAQPGVPNVYGLVGAEANAVEPGKRPLSSMSPTIVLADVRDHDLKTGRPILSVGAAGGPRIISATLQTIINHLDLGMPLDEAVAAARVHHQWSPDVLLVERQVPREVRQRLAALGHEAQPARGLAVVQAVGQEEDGTFTAAADPRATGGTSHSE